MEEEGEGREEGLSVSSWRWLGGRGAAARVEGERPEEPSVMGLSLGSPPGNRPPIGGAEPEGLAAPIPLAPPAAVAPPPLGLSAGFWGWLRLWEWLRCRWSWGALRSFTTDTRRSLVPLQMSESRAPRPPLRDGGLRSAWLRKGGGGGPPGEGGIGMVLLTPRTPESYTNPPSVNSY